jgi:quercetin dioxygenase-like cupin family protein
MKPMLSVMTLTLAGAAFMLPALAADEHTVLAPKDVKWAPGPPSLPKGAEVAMLAGDPSKDGPFVMRLKFPKGYQVPPHTHPKAEVVTVISGTVHVGMGETADKSKAQALVAGGFFAMPPGMQHFVSVDEEAVVQLNGTGPWAVTYVNPKDDPRQKSQ